MRHDLKREDLEGPAPSLGEGLAMVAWGVGLGLLIIGALFLLGQCYLATLGPR